MLARDGGSAVATESNRALGGAAAERQRRAQRTVERPFLDLTGQRELAS
jgi:hypothetical protein